MSHNTFPPVHPEKIAQIEACIKIFPAKTPTGVIMRCMLQQLKAQEILARDSEIFESSHTNVIYALRKFAICDLMAAIKHCETSAIPSRIKLSTFLDTFLSLRNELYRLVKVQVENYVNRSMYLTLSKDIDTWLRNGTEKLDYEHLSHLVEQLPSLAKENFCRKEIRSMTKEDIEKTLFGSSVALCPSTYYMDIKSENTKWTREESFVLEEYVRRYALYTKDENFIESNMCMNIYEMYSLAFQWDHGFPNQLCFVLQTLLEEIVEWWHDRAADIETILIEQLGVSFTWYSFVLHLEERIPRTTSQLADMKKLRKLLSAIVLEHTPVVESIGDHKGFYGSYTGRLSRDERCVWDHIEQAAMHGDTDYMKYILKKVEKHKTFFRYIFTKHGIIEAETAETIEVTLEKMNIIIGKTWKKIQWVAEKEMRRDAIVLEKAIKKYEKNLHARNSMIITHYPVAEQEKKLTILLIHKEKLSRYAKELLALQKKLECLS
jgi:hypothetical protein